MTTRKKTTTAGNGDLTFEQALERLEKLVEHMESAELPLDEMLRRYEEGQRLVQFCAQKLEDAEKRIEILSRNKDGSPLLKKFQVDEEDASSPREPNP